VHRLWEQDLYWHQWEALRRVIDERKSIVVATGTGSGKTECYLLPLLYMLVTEDPSVRALSGIRAILLFPMNALVEDQMRRLRKLLFWVNLASSALAPNTPKRLTRPITFGRYTGDTPVDEADSDRSQPPDHIRELGEKVTRADMQQEPPDILVTKFLDAGIRPAPLTRSGVVQEPGPVQNARARRSTHLFGHGWRRGSDAASTPTCALGKQVRR